MFKLILILVVFGYISGFANAQTHFETDNITTSGGDLKITFIGHASLIFAFDGKIIHVDPDGELADYSTLPKADIILITHEHSDHFDLSAIKILQTDQTKLVLTETCARKISGGIVMKNGDVQIIQGIKYEAIPAYNTIQKRDYGQPFHPKGVGNGYILTFGDKRVYVAVMPRIFPK